MIPEISAAQSAYLRKHRRQKIFIKTCQFLILFAFLTKTKFHITKTNIYGKSCFKKFNIALSGDTDNKHRAFNGEHLNNDGNKDTECTPGCTCCESKKASNDEYNSG